MTKLYTPTEYYRNRNPSSLWTSESWLRHKRELCWAAAWYFTSKASPPTKIRVHSLRKLAWSADGGTVTTWRSSGLH